MKLPSIAAALLLALSLPLPAAEWSLADVMPLSARTRDLTARGLTAANLNRFGFFSDLTYDARTQTWFALSDRGPGGGVIGYATRVQQLRIDVDPLDGTLLRAPKILRTIVFRTADGQPFNGLNPTLLNGSATTLGRSFDPEGLAVGRNGHLFVADEYGPSLYEFDADGRFLRAFEIPANLRPRQSDGQANFTDGRPTLTRGRQDNRGFEGLTFNASGTRLYGVLQDPLVDEGSGSDGRRSRFVRIVAFDPVQGTSTGQYAYPLESIATLNAIDPATADDFSATNQGRSIGLSAITALGDDEFIVLERDNRGLGVEVTATPLHKRLYRIDLRGASDISGLSLAGSNELPVGVTPVAKRAEADLLADLRAVGSAIPEKLEGVAFGPRLKRGGRIALVGSDNDYSVTQTGAGEQFEVCIDASTGARTQVPLDTACPAGSDLVPGYLISYRVR